MNDSSGLSQERKEVLLKLARRMRSSDIMTKREIAYYAVSSEAMQHYEKMWLMLKDKPKDYIDNFFQCLRSKFFAKMGDKAPQNKTEYAYLEGILESIWQDKAEAIDDSLEEAEDARDRLKGDLDAIDGAGNLLKMRQGAWIVRFDNGKRETYRDSKPLQYLRLLIKNQGRPVSPEEFAMAIDGYSGGFAHLGEHKEIHLAGQGLTYTKNPDASLADDKKEVLGRLIRDLGEAEGKKAFVKHYKNTPSQTDADGYRARAATTRKNIERIKNTFQDANLLEHLNDCIIPADRSYKYAPPQKVEWYI